MVSDENPEHYSPKEKMLRVVFNWSVFIRAVIDHMICYNLNWPKVKLLVHYFVFSCALDHILKRKKSIFQHFTRSVTF